MAAPWAEVGEAQLRSDIQLLAASGVLDSITSHWPLPWAAIRNRLESAGELKELPAHIRAAAERLKDIAGRETSRRGVSGRATVDVTNSPATVRGFDGLGREVAQEQLTAEIQYDKTFVRISAGAQHTAWSGGRNDFLPDGSVVSHEIGGANVYAGYVTHWWGPGWVSALSLSNNARPFPHVGIVRATTETSKSPWFSWIGPWQAEFLVGVLNGPRIDSNTLYSGLRVTLNPLPGLEIGLSRTQQFCGANHRCRPIEGYFDLSNDPGRTNFVNDQGAFDIRYSRKAWEGAFEVYTQIMNEDSNPIVNSYSSHLFGGSVWLPAFGRTLRLTAEYTSSIPTVNILAFGNYFHGYSYNNYDYVDGMRYRGRTLGFSLDSDSRLASLQAEWTDSGNRVFRLTYHRAWISTAQNRLLNVLTSMPIVADIAEARIRLPLKRAMLELAGRIEDRETLMGHSFEGSLETLLRYEIF